MTGFVWLASYPKSGNTWMRLLADNATRSEGPADINAMQVRDGIASARGEFERVTLIDSGLLTHEEAEALRPRVYEAIASGDEDAAELRRPRLIKVHDAYLTTRLGEPLLAGARGAKGAILIVRDPRDVAISFANHRNAGLDETIGFMAHPRAGLSAHRGRLAEQLRQRLLDWSGHAASWLDQTDLPVHLVRYEDLLADTAEVFRAAMAFAGWKLDPAVAERAARFSSFDELQAQERRSGFVEWSATGSGRYFFRRGQSQAWRNELSAEQIARIEAAHAPMMHRLGYAPTSEGASAPQPPSAGTQRG